MAELNRSQHNDLGGSWSTDPYFGGFSALQNNLFMPTKAEQVDGAHYPSMINLLDPIGLQLSCACGVYVYKDSADADAQFSVRPATVSASGHWCSYAGETALGSLATGDNHIWLDLSAAPTITAAFGAAWPAATTPHLRLATIAMPASGAWLRQHITYLTGAQAVTPIGCQAYLSRTDITIADDGTIDLRTVPANAIAGNCRVLVTEAFNGAAPTLKIGDSGDDDRHAETTDIDLATVDTYIIPRLHKYAAQTDVQAILDIDGSTTGAAVILWEQIP